MPRDSFSPGRTLRFNPCPPLMKKRPGGFPSGLVFRSFNYRLTAAVQRIKRGARGKMLFLDLFPTTEHIVDIDETDRRKLILELTDNLLVMDTVTELGCDPLTFLGVEEIQI